METLESLRTKIEGAQDLKSVVRSMKAMAAANISQYEMAVISLADYYHTVALGIVAYFREQKIEKIEAKKAQTPPWCKRNRIRRAQTAARS